MKGRGKIRGSLTDSKQKLYADWGDPKFGRAGTKGWDQRPGFDQPIVRSLDRQSLGARRPSPSRTDPSTRRS